MRRAEDVDLLARASEGDRIAFAALYDRYAPRWYGLALRIVGTGNDADDVLQQTWMQVWEQARSYDPSKASVGAWLVVRLRS
ncbi:MAG: sigma factor, partial [Planctomycetota bacterium]